MSVRFVLGRAGSGKTHRCLEAVRARLNESASQGPPLLLLVPEQSTFQTERALIETPGLTGYTRCSVVSFQRLASRVFAETSADPRLADRTIGSLGRLMVIRRLIRRERGSLQLFGSVADRPGLVKQVAASLDELMREDVAPDTLVEVFERLEEDNPLAAAKIADLTRLYTSYLDYLSEDRLDPAQFLRLAAERLGECAWLDEAELWVDGFAGFTGQEYHLLVELARRVRSMEITLLVDAEATAIDAEKLPGLSYSLFARTERTLLKLKSELKAAGVTMDESVRLRAERSPRFVSPSIAELERRVFSEHPRSDTSSGDDDAVTVVSFPDRRREVQAAVEEIVRLTRAGDRTMRYRDIAIIVRDLEGYHDLLSSALRAQGVPFFLDRRQPTTHHPLVELVRALPALSAEDCRLDTVRLALKTELLPFSNDEGDLLENYALAAGIHGRLAWNQPWTSKRPYIRRQEDGELHNWQVEQLAVINTLRQRWCDVLSAWLDVGAAQPERPGLDWASALWSCLDGLKVGAKLEDWAVEAERDGRSDDADAHRQVWRDYVELLDEFVEALGSEPMRISAFRETIEAGLAEFTLGLAPPTLDQVLVGSIERSRHPSIRAALVLGFDDQRFPKRRTEDPLLGDSERETLEHAGVEIGRSRRGQLLEERMLAYIALTRASERLWLSYPVQNEEGKPVSASLYLSEVTRALPGLVLTKGSDPLRNRSPAGISSVRELGGRLAAEFRGRVELADESEPLIRAKWNGLYELARERSDWHISLRRSLRGLGYFNAAELEKGARECEPDEPFLASVSELERFAECPFRHFAEYTLRLEPRLEAELQAVDLGTICHDILERLIAGLVEEKKSVTDLDDAEIIERVDQFTQQVLGRVEADMLLSDARNAYLLDRSREHLGRVVRWQRRASQVGAFQPRAVEFPFGMGSRLDAPLKLTTPGGREIHLRGKIDRVDIAELGKDLVGVVIDYKRTTERRLIPAKVFHGLTLQLVGYLLALKQTGKTLTGRSIRPVGAFYLPLLESFKAVHHPEEESKSSMKLRGVLETESLALVDSSVQAGGGSEFLQAKLKKDGDPDARSDLVDGEQMKLLMTHVGQRMGELADGILDGNVAVAPYSLSRKRPCSFCPMQAVCRFEIETQPPRYLDSMKKKDMLDRLDEAKQKKEQS